MKVLLPTRAGVFFVCDGMIVCDAQTGVFRDDFPLACST